ncbi:hypothetical protein POMI540_1278 [Schizosaccharomyces pombe]
MDDTGIVELNYSLSKYSPKFEMLRQLQLGISVFVYSNVVCRVSGIRAWKLQIHSKNLESKIEATVSEPEQIPCPGFGSDNIVPLSLVNDFKDGAFVNVLVAIQWKEEFEIFNNETTKSLPKQTIHVRDISGSAMIVLIGESQVKSALSWNNETILLIHNAIAYRTNTGMLELSIKDAIIQTLQSFDGKVLKLLNFSVKRKELIKINAYRLSTLEALEKIASQSGEAFGQVGVLIMQSKIKDLTKEGGLVYGNDLTGLRFADLISIIVDETGSVKNPKFSQKLLEEITNIAPTELSVLNEEQAMHLENVFLYRHYRVCVGFLNKQIYVFSSDEPLESYI